MSVSTSNRAQSPGNQPHIVIPYNYVNHAFAGTLGATLRRDRITTWIDEVDMSASAFLLKRLMQAARPVDCVVPVISAYSVTSNWVLRELRAAMSRSFGGRRVRVIPARIDDSVMPDFIESQSCCDFHRDGWSVAYNDLLVAVRMRVGPSPANRLLSAFRLPRPVSLT
jgi:hypothetical protein